MTKHFTAAELHTELTRAAYVVGVHGPYTWGAHVATLQRFITHPHFQEEPMYRLTAAQRRQITQKTGAAVSESGQKGIVVGHYDDDSVYVQFEGEEHPIRVYVNSLRLEPVTTTPALKSTQVALYRASLIQAVMPAVRIEPRVTGYMAGYRANTDLTPEPTPEQVEQYRRGLVEQFFGFQYCASAALGFRDGWALAVRESGR